MRSRGRSSLRASPSATPIPPARSKPLRRGLTIARDSGNRFNRITPGEFLSRLEAGTATRWPRSITSPWRSATYHDAGNANMIRITLAVLAAFFDRLGRYEPAATVAGFAFNPFFRRGRARDRRRDRPPTRCPRRPDLRIARPQGRGNDHRRHGDLRLRPNRPGPSRTERPSRNRPHARVSKDDRGSTEKRRTPTFSATG